MPDPSTEPLGALRALAHAMAPRAHVPYSGRHAAAVLLLADGTYVPGVRVESASYSLLIPALLNAFTTAVAAGRRDVVAAVLNHPFRAEEQAFVRSTFEGAFEAAGEGAFVRAATPRLPPLGAPLTVTLPGPEPETPTAGVHLARQIAERAHVPESAFPVGCVLATSEGLVPGVNVEHADWTRVLCAERNALGTAVSYGLLPAHALYVSLPKDASGTPCGACRQLLVELACNATLWMDRGAQMPEQARPDALLPGFFSGVALTREA